MRAAAQLQRCSLLFDSTDQQLAFWLNVLHALKLHSLLAHGPYAALAPDGAPLPRSPFVTSCYLVAGFRLSCADITCGILGGGCVATTPPPLLPLTPLCACAHVCVWQAVVLAAARTHVPRLGLPHVAHCTAGTVAAAGVPAVGSRHRSSL